MQALIAGSWEVDVWEFLYSVSELDITVEATEHCGQFELSLIMNCLGLRGLYWNYISKRKL